jgi:hypothetical protein
MLCLMALCMPLALAEPVALSPRWHVSFPAMPQGAAAESTAVPLDASLLVAVVASGADPAAAKVMLGSRLVSGKLLGFDPVSRLQFIRTDGTVPLKRADWSAEVGGNLNSELTALTATGPEGCRASGWVKQVGGKVLPFALLRVVFVKSVPATGTPLQDQAGRVVAILFQNAEAANTAYAIPCEAVRRVQRDVAEGGSLKRGWLGLALLAEAQAPTVVRVIENSPAAEAGILPGDLLVKIGARRITDYADAANAFFYLIPGQEVKVNLLRRGKSMEFTLIPKSAA